MIPWNNLPISLEDIEHIEIIRSPDTAVYASNALQAVINIQTASPYEYKGASMKLTRGMNDIQDGFLRYAGRLGNMDYMVSASRKSDGGYEDVYDSHHNDVLSFLGEVPLAEGDIQLQAGFAKGINQFDPPVPRLQGPPHEFPETNNYQTLRWNHLFNPNNELTATLSHNHFTYADKSYIN